MVTWNLLHVLQAKRIFQEPTCCCACSMNYQHFVKPSLLFHNLFLPHWPPNDTHFIYFRYPCKIHDPAYSCFPVTEFSGCQVSTFSHFCIYHLHGLYCACLPLRNASTLPCGISASSDSDLSPRESRKFSILVSSSNHFNFLYSQLPNEW